MIYLSVIVKNEADRYLDKTLKWNSSFANKTIVYDDKSTDNSVSIAKQYATVIERNPNDISFIENESQFRTNAYQALIETFKPTEDDWIISIDADEIITGKQNSIVKSMSKDHDFLAFPLVELWSQKEDGLYYRTDGFWATEKQTRIWKYNPIWKFRNTTMGCGSTPVSTKVFVLNKNRLVHLGYLKDEDKKVKHLRYKNHRGNHNKKHIDSILQTPVLKKWDGETLYV